MQTNTKKRILELLDEGKGSFVSGAALARVLGISRNSVSKAVSALRAEGHVIESVTNRGHRLVSSPSTFDARSIARLIDNPRITVEFHDTVSSTNTVAKQRAEEGAPEGTLIVANSQSAGRGRQGRSFSSPKDTGVYFTLILRPRFALGDVALVTSYAACCLAATIDECTDRHAQIKWVNDVFVDGCKVSGILSEASFDAETQSVAYVVVGIGVNVIEPEGGFDDETNIAGALVDDSDDANTLRCHIVADTVNRFMRDYERIPSMPHLADYRARSLLDGRHVEVHAGIETFEAQVIGIDWQKEEQRYTVWMHMASLAEDTGQRKQSAETQPGNELYFTGSDGAQIHTAYEATREQYLDIGHVKAVIFGTSLRENRERLREVLKGMESESSLGNSLCIFTTDSLSELSQAVEEQGISLGDFLTGLYENRTDSSAQAPVRLADLYRSCHTDTALPQIPGITVKDRVLMVEKK